MQRQISIARSKQIARQIKEARAEVSRVRTLALAGRRSGGSYERKNAIHGYQIARENLARLRLILAEAVIVKGVTRHYTGCRFAA